MKPFRVTERVRRVITDQLGLDDADLKLSSTLDDVGADSLDTIEIVMHLEEDFEVSITDEEAIALRTLNDIFLLLAAKGVVDQP